MNTSLPSGRTYRVTFFLTLIDNKSRKNSAAKKKSLMNHTSRFTAHCLQIQYYCNYYNNDELIMIMSVVNDLRSIPFFQSVLEARPKCYEMSYRAGIACPLHRHSR